MSGMVRAALLMMVCAIVTAEAVKAAEVELLDLPAEIDLVNIQGEITEGDGDRFYDLVKDRERISVILRSPGGLVREALQIGAEIRMRGFTTIVLPDEDCYSACGLIWVSGARRYMSETSRIGFHAAYREENGEYLESGVANAEIGSFLTHLGLRIEAIRFFTVAGPDEFLMLTPERARALGIDVFELDGKDVISPQDAPTADVHAHRWVSYAVLQSYCSDIFQPDVAVIKRGQQNAFDAGNEIVGAEKWIDLWTPVLDEVKSQRNSKGALNVCIETEANLRSQGLPTGVDGPSFACSNASTATEEAICADTNLWTKDRATNSIYLFVRKHSDAPMRKRLLAAQRNWLQERNACGGDRECLNRAYDDWLQNFKDMDIRS